MAKFDKPARPQSYPLKVRVTDGKQPLNDAFVTIESLDGRYSTFNHTDINGEAGFTINRGVEDVKVTVVLDGYRDYVGYYVLAFGTTDLPVTLEKLIIPEINPWDKLTEEQLLAFKGNFGGIHVENFPYHPFKTVYTPAYLTFNDASQWLVREGYKQRGYTHMPVVIHNGKIYRDFFPELNLSVLNRRAKLIELYKDGIIPIVTVMADEESRPSNDFKGMSDLIRVAFVKWEMNQPSNNSTEIMCQNIIDARRALRSDALLFVHFSPKHGAGIGDKSFWYDPNDPMRFSMTHIAGWTMVPSRDEYPDRADSNSLWWNWADKVGIKGILLQGEPTESSEDQISLATDFTERFGTGLHGYPKGLAVILFEFKVLQAFWDGLTEAEELAYMAPIRTHNYIGKQPEGFCNG